MIQMSADPARQENSLAHCRWAFSGTPFEEKWQVQWGKYVRRSENIRKGKNDDSHEPCFFWGGCPMVQSYFRETHVFFFLTMFERPEVGPMVFHDLKRLVLHRNDDTAGCLVTPYKPLWLVKNTALDLVPL